MHSVAIVTGAAQGIGHEIALRFARAGYAVVLADLDGARAAAVANAIVEAGGQALGLTADVADGTACEAMARAALERFERVDVLVNNAAVRAAERVRFWEIEEAFWDRMMAVNVKGTWLAMKAVAPTMQRQGSGSIVNIVSASYLIGAPNLMHYNASKAAVIGITRSAARELGDYKVRVNAILPGSVETEIPNPPTALSTEDAAARSRGRIIKRPAVPGDIAGVALFLVSDAAGYMTGQCLNVDGGQSFL